MVDTGLSFTPTLVVTHANGPFKGGPRGFSLTASGGGPNVWGRNFPPGTKTRFCVSSQKCFTWMSWFVVWNLGRLGTRPSFPLGSEFEVEGESFQVLTSFGGGSSSNFPTPSAPNSNAPCKTDIFMQVLRRIKQYSGGSSSTPEDQAVLRRIKQPMCPPNCIIN